VLQSTSIPELRDTAWWMRLPGIGQFRPSRSSEQGGTANPTRINGHSRAEPDPGVRSVRSGATRQAPMNVDVLEKTRAH
jgi:hypothetical protein